MKEIRLGKIVVEGIIGAAIALAAEGVAAIFVKHKKKENLDSVLVGELTVGELREILRQEA